MKIDTYIYFVNYTAHRRNRKLVEESKTIHEVIELHEPITNENTLNKLINILCEREVLAYNRIIINNFKLLDSYNKEEREQRLESAREIRGE